MAHDVFISYSFENKAVADAICAMLENRKIRCWLAPRDVPPGKLYGAALINAVKSARVMVLVLSADTNQSQYVVRELNAAVAKGIPIIPFRIEEVQPSDELGFYIDSLHWLDAMNPPLERDLTNLANSVVGFLSAGDVEPSPAQEELISSTVKKRKPLTIWTKVLIGAIPLIILILFIIWNALTPEPVVYVAPSDLESENSSQTIEENTLPTQASEALTSPEWSDWKLLSFNIPNDTLWNQIGDNSYEAFAGHSQDTFAWSEELIEGDLILNLDIGSLDDQASGSIIVYGDGTGFSSGNLIFSLEDRIFWVEKHTPYHQGENFLAVYESDIDFQNQIFSVTIEISKDKVNYIIDGEKIASFFIPAEINRSGRIGIYQNWEVQHDRTFSNIKIKTGNVASGVVDPTEIPTPGPIPSTEVSSETSWSDWEPLSFVFPNPRIWEKSGDNNYIAIEQQDVDAFAWSTENFEGDISLSLDLKSAVKALDLSRGEMISQIPNQNSGCVIVYGDGHEHSHGSFVFCIDWDGYYLHEHTIYHQDEPLAFIPIDNDSDKVYSVKIEITNDIATMYVNGELVLSSIFDLEEIDRSGRIGLFRNWAKGEITFSDVQVKTTTNG